MTKPIAERLTEFYRRLQAADPVKDADQALTLISRVLEQVEDDLSGIPRQAPPPNAANFDGRLYPPLDDMIRRLPDGGIVARTRKHSIIIGTDGSITILRTASGIIELSKLGAKP